MHFFLYQNYISKEVSYTGMAILISELVKPDTNLYRYQQSIRMFLEKHPDTAYTKHEIANHIYTESVPTPGLEGYLIYEALDRLVKLDLVRSKKKFGQRYYYANPDFSAAQGIKTIKIQKLQ